MCYVGNVADFIKWNLQNTSKGYRIYNYIDKPDLSMNELLDTVSEILEKKLPSIKVPYFIGMLGGYGFDLLAFITRKKLSISSVRVKKFCATTQFDSSKMLNSGFVPPFSLKESLSRTIKHEFIDPKKDEPIFEGGG